MKRTWAILLGLWLAWPAQAGIYHWVDGKGRVHFGDKPPANLPYEDLSGQPVANTVSSRLFFSSLDPDGLRERVTITLRGIDMPLQPEQQAEAEEKIRLVYALYEQLFEWPRGRAFPIHATLVGNPEKFHALRTALTGLRSYSVIGFYVADRNESYVLARERWPQTLATLLHEVSHAILRLRVTGAPIWINEGLAENFETISLQDGMLHLGIPGGHLTRLAAMRQGDTLPGLERFLRMPVAEWHGLEDDRQGEMYALAWGVVHFFLVDEARRRILRDMIHAAGRAPDAFDARALINLKYPGGVARFIREWNGWMQGQLDAARQRGPAAAAH